MAVELRRRGLDAVVASRMEVSYKDDKRLVWNLKG
jgi:hypothetical protein